jgi:hypothetical protein
VNRNLSSRLLSHLWASMLLKHLSIRDILTCEVVERKWTETDQASSPHRSGANHSIPYYGLAAPLKSLQSEHLLRLNVLHRSHTLFSVLDDTDTVLGIDLPTLLTEDGRSFSTFQPRSARPTDSLNSIQAM